MITIGVTLVIGILIVTVGWLLFAAFKLKQKNEIISYQGQEIKKQVLELEERRKELSDLMIQNKHIVSVVSHDLKGPFNRIFALVQLLGLSAENLTKDQHEYLDKIHQIVADGLGMLRNLLDNRRIEDKGIEFNNEKLNLAILIGSLVKSYQMLADKKGIHFHFQSPPQAILVSDKLYLMRIVENLLSNALKFSEVNQNVFVQIEDHALEVVISIKDEGPGINEEDQKKLYLKLQRLTATPTGGESSTGLGLWIVKTILDRMGGRIECQSLNKGTTFKVYLKKQPS